LKILILSYLISAFLVQGLIPQLQRSEIVAMAQVALKPEQSGGRRQKLLQGVSNWKILSNGVMSWTRSVQLDLRL
jgi:hypothetical protein